MSITRRRILKSTGGGLAGVLASGVAPYGFVRNIVKAAEGDTIKVGILHSLSGTIAIIESSLHNAELLAIEEINAKGGVLGKKLQPVVEDPQSLVQVFAEKAKKLLLDDKVVAVLGCYTSASRQSVLPVFEENNGVLLYPTLYEAQECSKNCFYTGAVPNQQLDDFVPWIIKTLGRKKFYLIAPTIYPRTTARSRRCCRARRDDGGGGIYAGLDRVLDQHQRDRLERRRHRVLRPGRRQIVTFYKQFRGSACRQRRPIYTPITTERRSRRWGRKPSATTPRSTTSERRHARTSRSSTTKAKYGKDAVTNGDGSRLLPDLLPRPGDREVKSTDTDALILRTAGQSSGAAGQGQDRREEPPHLAVGPHRPGEREGPVRRGVEVGRLDPPAAVGALPLSEQVLRFHRQARARSREEALERRKEPLGND
jgi:hypothetical protein